MDKTLDKLRIAKSALIDALREAEREAPKSILNNLNRIVGETEMLQHKIKQKIDSAKK